MPVNSGLAVVTTLALAMTGNAVGSASIDRALRFQLSAGVLDYDAMQVDGVRVRDLRGDTPRERCKRRATQTAPVSACVVWHFSGAK